MSQIPVFLKSLSALVRQLVADKRAVHVTAKTADELDLLAGLPWDHYCKCMHRDTHIGELHPGQVSPADISLGWLRLSSARLGAESGYYFANKVDVLRAAECAELCALASSWSNWSAAVNEATKTETLTYHTARPHDGTIEGARAAWGFVVEQVRLKLSIAEKGFLVEETERGKVNLYTNGPTGRYQHRKQQMAEMFDTFRRELEAMK